MIDFDYYEEYLTSISNKILMAGLRKPNFHSINICRLMESQPCEKISRRKTDSN